MRANAVFETQATQTTSSAADDLTRRKTALLYELELEFRKTAKTLLRHGTPSGPVLIRRPAAGRPDRAQLFDIDASPAGDVLSFTYPWGQGKPRTDILRDDLQRWVTDYFSA